MAYSYIYLSLIPAVIAIAFLIFNTEIQKKYNTKKAGANLLWFIIIIALDFTWHVIANNYIFTKSSVFQYPLWFFVSIFTMGALYPVFVFTRYKLGRKKDILDEKWFQIILAFVVLAVFILIPILVIK